MKIINKKKGRPAKINFPITKPVEVPENWVKNLNAYTSYWKKKGFKFQIAEESGKFYIVPVDTVAEGEDLYCFCANGGREGLNGICTKCGNHVAIPRQN